MSFIQEISKQNAGSARRCFGHSWAHVKLAALQTVSGLTVCCNPLCGTYTRGALIKPTPHPQ